MSRGSHGGKDFNGDLGSDTVCETAHYIFTLKVERVRSFQTMVTTYKTTLLSKPPKTPQQHTSKQKNVI